MRKKLLENKQDNYKLYLKRVKSNLLPFFRRKEGLIKALWSPIVYFFI